MHLKIDLPIETVSEANRRDHWSRKAARVKKQRADSYYFCKSQFPAFRALPDDKIEIKLTRQAPRVLDDDNLRSSLKAVRDGIADWLKIDDGSDRLNWVYNQEKISKSRAVAVELSVEKQNV